MTCSCTRSSPCAEELQQLLAEAGLAVERMPEAGDSLTVVRGARSRYSYTLGLPVTLDAEDVPEEITAALLEPAYLHEVIVEGSSLIETPQAVRFARRLAQASARPGHTPSTICAAISEGKAHVAQ